ncbi:MAG: cell wall-binding repeat-containing protein [Desulfitobacterium sp.]
MANWKKHTPILAFMLVCISIFILTLSQSVLASTTTSRLAGADRYLTALAISQSGWPEGAAEVVLTTGENYPDALSAAPLAGKYDAPILLVSSKGLSPETLTELKRLNPKKAYIVGGTGVIPNSVDSQLTANGISSSRLAGKDRYETAMAVARSVGLSKGVFFVPGLSFADALSAAPIAAAEGMPIIPVPADDFTKSQKSYFSKAKIGRVIFVGSKADIPQTIRGLFTGAENIDGLDAYVRNSSLLKYFEGSINTDKAFLATGQTYPDALAAAAFAQQDYNPVILLKGNEITSSVKSYFSTKVINKITVLGGEGIISSTTVSRLANLTPTITEVEDIDVKVLENQSYALPVTVAAKTSQGNLAQVPVTWNLTDVSTDRAGTYYYSGSVNGYDGTVHLALTVEPGITKVDTFQAEVIQGSTYTLPKTVIVTKSDYSTSVMDVKWSSTPTVTILNKIGTYTFQGVVEGTNQTTNLSLKVSADKAIEFKDSSFEWAVKFSLGKQSSAQPIYLSEVLKITSLNLKGYGIRDLTGLDSFTNLRTLDLSNNFLKSANLSQISRLANLKSLDLMNNDLDLISSLTSLKSLTQLDISLNKIKDFSPIRDLTRLTSLSIKGNATQDYSPTRLYYDQLIEKDFDI